jgi:hypothetical protein
MRSRSALWAMILTVCAVVGASPTKAIPITYELTLTPLLGTTAGTGWVTVDRPIGPGFDSFSPDNGLLSLEFHIGGNVFTLGNADPDFTPNVTFAFGHLFNISYFGAIGAVSLSTLFVGYTYIDKADRSDNTYLGLMLASAAPVPGPMVGAGLPGLVVVFGGLIIWWRRRQAAPAQPNFV